MLEFQLQDLIRKSLAKLVPAGTAGLFPFPFASSMIECEEFRISSPIVGSQLVYTEKAQLLSYIILDPGTLVKLGKLIFPKMDRKESLSMVVSAAEEILNTASSKLGFLLGKLEGAQNPSITAPMVLDLSGDKSISIPGKDSFFLRMTYQDMAIEYSVTAQTV